VRERTADWHLSCASADLRVRFSQAALESAGHKETTQMKFISGIVLGIVLSAGTVMFAQRGEMHPRLVAAITAIRDARAYMMEAPHDFGGHKAAAIRACDEAIRQLDLARAYRPR